MPKVWRSTCPLVKSAAMVGRMSWAPRAVSRPPCWWSSSAGLSAPRPGGPFVVDPDLQVLVPAGMDGDLVECAVLAVPDGDVALTSGSVKLLTGSVDCVAEAAYISQEYLRRSHMPSGTR